jgi:hypothetical protein
VSKIRVVASEAKVRERKKISSLLDADYEMQLREEAQASAPKALEKLKALMESEESPLKLQRDCANDILRHAAPAPGAAMINFPGGGSASSRGGFTINVIHMSGKKANGVDGDDLGEVVEARQPSAAPAVIPREEADDAEFAEAE